MADGGFLGCAMGTGEEFDALVEACITNHERVIRYGSPEMQTASRLLLFALAEEIRRRGETSTEDEE